MQTHSRFFQAKLGGEGESSFIVLHPLFMNANLRRQSKLISRFVRTHCIPYFPLDRTHSSYMIVCFCKIYVSFWSVISIKSGTIYCHFGAPRTLYNPCLVHLSVIVPVTRCLHLSFPQQIFIVGLLSTRHGSR